MAGFSNDKIARLQWNEPHMANPRTPGPTAPGPTAMNKTLLVHPNQPKKKTYFIQKEQLLAIVKYEYYLIGWNVNWTSKAARLLRPGL
jgi:hypothetical protein